MNDGIEPRLRLRRLTILGTVLGICAILGGVGIDVLQSPGAEASRTGTSRHARPIVQIVREQAGAPDLSAVIAKVCPSLGFISSSRSDSVSANRAGGTAAAFAYSTDGWLVTSFAETPKTPLKVMFGDGRQAMVTELRDDPVSGIAIAKADSFPTPLTLVGEAFPKVGQFGLAVGTRTGNGCLASPAMVGGDFLADGRSGAATVRMTPTPQDWSPGTALFDTDGNVIAVGASGQAGDVLPAPLVGVIVDELVRQSPSPTAAFGFRAIDFGKDLSERMGDSRSGAGVAIVKSASPAAKAGILAGDIITAVDGRPISSSAELGRSLDSDEPSFDVVIDRRGEKLTLTLQRLRGLAK